MALEAAFSPLDCYNPIVADISIIVVNYNQNQDTRECVASLTKLKRNDHTVHLVIVDNASTKPFKLPKNLQKSWFEVIASQANLGFTGGNNLGIHYAIEHYNSDYIWLLNNDTLVDPMALLELLRHVEAYPTHGLASSLIYFAANKEFHSGYKLEDKGNVIWYGGGSIDWRHLSAFHRGVDEIDWGQFDTQIESDFATGCSVLIKREVLEKIGYLDKRYFLYLEDVDLSLRAREAGYAIGFAARSKVWHKNAGSSGGPGSVTAEYYQTRNRHFLAFQHGDWKSKLVSIRIMLAQLRQSKWRRKAILDFIVGRMGKQPLI